MVLDASVLIAHLESNDLHHRRATEVLLAVPEEELGISPITLAEVLVGPASKGVLAVVEQALQTLEIVTIAIDEAGPTRLAELRVATRLRMPDCCVILAAQTVGGSIATFDERLQAAAYELGLTVHSA